MIYFEESSAIIVRRTAASSASSDCKASLVFAVSRRRLTFPVRPGHREQRKRKPTSNSSGFLAACFGKRRRRKKERGAAAAKSVMMAKGVTGGPSGPSREGPGVGHKIVSDTEQMTKERKKEKKGLGKGKKCVKKKKTAQGQ